MTGKKKADAAHQLLSKVHFISGNANKVREVRALLGEVQHIDLDLPELQELDPRKVVLSKARSALEQGVRPVLIEDTSLSVLSLGGLPGPLVKWWLKGLGCDGLYRFASMNGDTTAEARTIFGLAFAPQTILYGEGFVRGHIVAPKGEGFGWDSVFCPDGSHKTFGEMTLEEKSRYSMRSRALAQLRIQVDRYLDSQRRG